MAITNPQICLQWPKYVLHSEDLIVNVVLFIASWNDFFLPNIFIITASKMTLPVGIASLVGTSGNTNVILMMASVGMQIVPLLLIFIFTQRFLIQSISTTGIRG